MTAKEFELLITNSTTKPEVLEIYYSDGTIIEGFVQHVTFSNPPFVNLTKSVVPRGENSDHTVRFQDIIKLIVKPFNQEPIIYE